MLSSFLFTAVLLLAGALRHLTFSERLNRLQNALRPRWRPSDAPRVLNPPSWTIVVLSGAPAPVCRLFVGGH